MNRRAMIEVLQANELIPELTEKLQLFGQFVGSWDAKVINYKSDETAQIVGAE